jgi:hypothetical protein
MQLRVPDIAGELGRIRSANCDVESLIGAVDVINVERNVITRDTAAITGDKHSEFVMRHPQHRSLIGCKRPELMKD